MQNSSVGGGCVCDDFIKTKHGKKNTETHENYLPECVDEDGVKGREQRHIPLSITFDIILLWNHVN